MAYKFNPFTAKFDIVNPASAGISNVVEDTTPQLGGDLDLNGHTVTDTDWIKDTHIDWGTGAGQVSAVDVPIADGGSIITGTEVETALQENRTAINLNTSKVTSKWEVDGTETQLISADEIDMQEKKIINLANATACCDAVNLQTLLEYTGVTINYWIGSQTLDTTLTDSEASYQETPSSDPETLSTITFKSSVADTNTPFTVTEGTIITVHISANVTSTAGKHTEKLKFKLGYVDSDGTSNFTQIGSDSDATATLTAVKTDYIIHIHVASGIIVPAGKRLWLKCIADATLSGGAYPEINVYYDEDSHHLSIPVSGTVLENFVQKSGDTMTGTLAMGANNITMTGSLSDTTNRVTKGWFDDLEVTNAIAGSITGQAATVATIAGLAPNTATTQAAQPSITSLGSLTSLTMAGDIQLGETDIKLDAALSGDEKWSGIVIAGVSGVTTLAVGDLCYLNANDSRWELVDANLSDGYDKQLGICVLAAADGAATEMLVYGKVRSAAFPAFTVGSPLYISETAGDMTHTAPTTTDSATRLVGFAITVEDLMFNPSNDYYTHT